MSVVNYQDIESKIIIIQNQKVLLDSDVASLYDVETKRINEAVKNNPEKFPQGYIFEVSKEDKLQLVENFDRFESLKHSVVVPKAFTEKGLYMLATILKSSKATMTTIAIIETFAKVRELTHTLASIQSLSENNVTRQKALLHKASELVSELIVADENLDISESETIIEMGFPFFRIKKSIKKSQK